MPSGLQLRSKIVAPHLVVAAFLFAIGCFSFYQLSGMGAVADDVHDLLAKSRHASKLMQTFLLREDAVRRYLTSGHEELVARFDELAVSSAEIGQLIGQSETDPERLRKLEELARLDEQYTAAYMDEIVPRTRATYRNAHDLLTNRGPTVESTLNNIIERASRDGASRGASAASSTLKEFLLGRLYLSEFLVSNEESDAERVRLQMLAAHNGYLRMEALLKDSQLRELAAAASQLMVEYEAGAEAIIEAVTARNLTVETMLHVTGPELQEGVSRIEQSLLAKLEESSTGVETTARKTSLVIVSLAAAALLIGIVLATGASRAVAQPLAELNDRMALAARGRLPPPTAAVSDDEIGQLSRSFDEILQNLAQMLRQARAIAADDLGHASLDAVKGDLGEAFTDVIHRMKYIASQADHLAAGELHHSELADEATGTVGSSMIALVRNWRQQTEEHGRLRVELEQAMETRESLEEVEQWRCRVREVADEMAGTLTALVDAAGQLSSNTGELAKEGDQHIQTVATTASALDELGASAHRVGADTGNLAKLTDDNSAALIALTDSMASVAQNAEQMSNSVMTNSTAIHELAASIQSQA